MPTQTAARNLFGGTARMKRLLPAIKCITVVAFMVTLFATYYVRSEVLKLNRIRFSSDDMRAEENVRQMKESYPVRMAEYEAEMKDYELRMEHYNEMLELYRTDYDAYVKRLRDHYAPPELPTRPHKPKPPEWDDRLAGINADFRAQQLHYFDSTYGLNWVCCVSALTLVGGLLLLIMFETGNQRIFYLAVLILSFVFMIGPSFHTLMSTIVGLLRAPAMY